MWTGLALLGTRNRVDGISTPAGGAVLTVRCRCGARLTTTEQQLAAGARVLQPLDQAAELDALRNDPIGR
jgi:hypothetical protein